VILAANDGMSPDDLLSVSISGHGIRRMDASGDEADGWDEGLVLADEVWWDDDIWTFLQGLRPCRIELFTDTCHAEGNWRAIGHAVTLDLFRQAPRYVQLDLFDDAPATRSESLLQIIQFAGCREESYSYGTASGGTWTQTLNGVRYGGIKRRAWYNSTAALMPMNQPPVFSTYNASKEFTNGIAFQ